MTFPGLQDFYDGMNNLVAHEAEQALQNAEHHQDLPHHDSPFDHHDPLDGHVDHGIGALRPDPHHQQEHPSLLDRLVPAAITGMATAAVKFAAEMATDAIISQAMLGELGPQTHENSEPLQVGSTDGDGFTHQTTGFTCAVVSQQMILHQFHLIDPQTGQPLSEARLTYDATANGWLTDHGTSLNDLSKLLQHYGVESHEGHDVKHLVHDLAEGHQVVMAVNADRLWNEHSPLSDFMNLFGNAPNHALVVKGLRVDHHGKVVVVVNDPGQADGAGVEYPLEHFQSAVDSSHLHYIATDHAPPDWSPAPEIRALSADTEFAFTPYHLPVTDGDHPTTYADVLSQMNETERAEFLRDL